MSDIRIQAPVTIRESLGEGKYRASLPNGKIIFAFSQPLDNLPEFFPGDEFSVLLSPCNFDEGRLVPPDLQGVKVTNPVTSGMPA